MSDWQSETIDRGGRPMFVYRTAPGRPVLLLIHGYTDSGRSWQRLAEELADQYTVLAPDLFGHGQSARLDGPTPMATFVDDLLALLADEGAEQVAVGGHSMGGVLAAALAARLPGQVGALILEDPAWVIHETPAPEYFGNADWGRDWREWIVELRALSREKMLAAIAEPTEGFAPLDRDIYLADRLDFDLAIFDWLDFSLRRGWRDHLQTQTAPLLLVTGDPARGGIIHDDFAAEIFGLNGGGERLHVPAAGHGIHREAYEAFRDGVVAFLGRHFPGA
ncbi:MAG: alpha/beta hydrolase [Anaerolineales bacterium]|nr:alpha/beta hydrolase [Anaerolineales bacterium]MCB0011389.1 alpha/beta hydrolase [Anaerolineales bacterium]MCB0017762.1 alpha/beta hydrolase [Anaerolineales bacterium]MCB0031638.1 alpha/beta hydrolase [Anaerolineales bacterium]